jgi:chemotaxis protein histidine kinase CheA/ActR/RegA family two-component response regulator
MLQRFQNLSKVFWQPLKIFNPRANNSRSPNPPPSATSDMSQDPTIREQTYQYFLQEAPELMQTLEQGLLSLKENWGINQVNDLMRATHTLKGAAISVGLDTIARIAHSMEDVFKALCRPDISLDPEIEALLFEGLECLRSPLMAELNGSSVDDGEVLNRTASIFARLQEKLGDCFDQQPYLPTSSELGFDLTQSLFEIGVTQQLEQIEALLSEPELETVATGLRSHADILLGLAESLNLSGFGAIAKAAIAALDAHPEEAMTIARTALEDFRAGQAAVFAGERVQGGAPSSTLQQLSGLTFTAEATDDSSSNSLFESIWGSTSDTLSGAEEFQLDANQVEPAALSSAVQSEQWVSPLNPPPLNAPFNPQLQKSAVSPTPTVRVGIKHLDQLNYAVGELVTHQNRQSLQTEQLQTAGKTLLGQIKRHQQVLMQLQDETSRHTNQLQREQSSHRTVSYAKGSGKAGRRSKKGRSLLTSSGTGNYEQNTSALIQLLLDQSVQLSETAEAIQLLSDQASQLLEKQYHLLTGTQDALIEARMLPLSEIFGRFPHALQKLETLHSKSISLDLQGGEVLVDKAVADRLFDPLLHLIRNAFAHGIEMPEIRQQRGKPAKGRITLCAYHHGRHLVIEVQDDGNGLDFDQIRQRAIERQLISLEQASRLTPEQTAELLFEPGFSTASQVDDLSGRGVGLDAVRNQMRAISGKVTVQSRLHQGTTFILQIPLNLTIAQLFVCEAGSKTYALLDDTVEQILIPRSSQLQEHNGGKFLRWGQGADELLVPVYSLDIALNYDTPSYDMPLRVLPSSSFFVSNEPASPIILIRCQEQLLGLEVDRLIGEQKLVIRPLGTSIHPPQYVHGASTLADGRLTLVLDATTLLQRIIRHEYNNNVSSHWAEPVYETLQALPEPPSPSQLPSSAPPQLAPEFRARPNTRVLVVDDSITTRQSLLLTLEKAGYQVLQAQDGQEGLELFQHQSNIQLVICDIEMPRMNGFEFLRTRQQLPQLANTPVVILSSRSDEKHRMLASQLGATVYMVKPFMEHKLLTMVKTVLEQTN